jgi:hypothetical protein
MIVADKHELRNSKKVGAPDRGNSSIPAEEVLCSPSKKVNRQPSLFNDCDKLESF